MGEPVKGPWLKRTLIRVLESLIAANERAVFGVSMREGDTPKEPPRDVTPEKKRIPGPGGECAPEKGAPKPE